MVDPKLEGRGTQAVQTVDIQSVQPAEVFLAENQTNCLGCIRRVAPDCSIEEAFLEKTMGTDGRAVDDDCD